MSRSRSFTMSSRNETVEVDIDAVMHETDSAYLVQIGSDEVWLPKSQCSVSGKVALVPEWLAEKEGLI